MYCFMWHHVTHGCTVNCGLDSVYIRRVVLGEVLHSYSAVTLLYGDGLLLYTVIISKKEQRLCFVLTPPGLIHVCKSN